MAAQISHSPVWPALKPVGDAAEEILLILSKSPPITEAEIMVRSKMRKEDVRMALELLAGVGLLQISTSDGKVTLDPTLKDILLMG